MQEQVKAKRAKKGAKKSRKEIKIENGEIAVQRLSAGKAQKFSRIGPREFVSFEYNEVTIENLKRACEQHFDVKIGRRALFVTFSLVSRGRPAKTVEQIPNIKMIHVRFILRKGVDIIESDGDHSTSLMSMGKPTPRNG